MPSLLDSRLAASKPADATQRILIVGAGGLGFACALGLAQLSDDQLEVNILDFDSVELSNLNRQLFFSPSDVGKSKAERLCAKLNELRPGRFIPRVGKLDRSNAAEFLAGVGLLIDCTDSVQTKLLLNDLAVDAGLGYVYGGAIAEEGAALLRPGPGAACLRCVFGDFSSADLDRYGATCSRAGIMGPVAGMVGIVQAQLAERWLRGEGEPLLFRVTGHSPSARGMAVERDPKCPVCGGREVSLDLTAERCPMTFLYTKLAFEALAPGDSLTVKLADADTAKSVFQSADEAGYNPLGPHGGDEDGWTIVFSPRMGVA